MVLGHTASMASAKPPSGHRRSRRHQITQFCRTNARLLEFAQE